MTNNMNGMYPNGMAMNGMGQPMQPQNAIPHTEDWLTPDMDSLMQKGDSQFNLAVSVPKFKSSSDSYSGTL